MNASFFMEPMLLWKTQLLTRVLTTVLAVNMRCLVRAATLLSLQQKQTSTLVWHHVTVYILCIISWNTQCFQLQTVSLTKCDFFLLKCCWLQQHNKCSWCLLCPDDKQARIGVNQPLFMFVFRVLLGRPYVCREPKQFKRPPCTDTSCCSDTCSKHSLYDSVIGTHNFTGSSSSMMSLHLPLMHSMQVVINVTVVNGCSFYTQFCTRSHNF